MVFFKHYRLDKNVPIPLYYQLKNIIVKCVRDLPDGMVIPTTHEIMAYYGISDTTVRLAMQELVKEGVVSRKKGVGTIVNKQRTMTERYNAISSMDLYAPLDFAKANYPEFSGHEFTVGISVHNNSTPFYLALNSSLQEKLALYQVQNTLLDADGDIALQKEHIKDLAASRVDLIVSNPYAPPSAFTFLLNDLSKQGIPILSIDSHFDKPAPFLTHIGCDNYQLGLRVGIHIAGYMKRTLHKEAIRLALIEGPAGTYASMKRVEGLMAGLHELYAPEQISVEFRYHGDWSRESGYAAIMAYEGSCAEIDIIYAQSDNMMLGAYEAAQYLHLDNLHYAGIDGSKDAFKIMMDHGPFLAIGINNPQIIGSLTATMVVKFLATKNIPSKSILTEPVIVTSSNVHSYYNEQSLF